MEAILLSRLLRCHLFGFAFLAHQFQFALGGFDLGETSCCTVAAASSSSGESWTLR